MTDRSVGDLTKCISIIVPRSSHKQHWRSYLLPSYQLMMAKIAILAYRGALSVLHSFVLEGEDALFLVHSKAPCSSVLLTLIFNGSTVFHHFYHFCLQDQIKFSQHWHWAYNPGNYKLYHHQFWFHIQPILSPPSSTSPWSSAWSMPPLSSKSSSHHDNKNQDKSSDENSKCHPRQSTSAKSNQPPFQEIKIKTKGRAKLSSHILNQPVIGSLLREWYPQLFGPRVWRSAWAWINEFKIVVKVDQFMLLWILKNTWSIVEQRCHYVLCKTPPKP